jgi:prepilin-type N-terminal cleavage/methylation domain-containing protein
MLSTEKRNKGFTLVELLVVISIISLLSSIVFGFVGESRVKAASATSAEQARQVKSAILIDSLSGGYSSQYSASDGGGDDGGGDGGGGSVTYKAKDVPRIVSNIGGDSESFPKISSTISKVADYYYISNGERAADAAGVDYYCLAADENDPVLARTTNQKAIIAWHDESVGALDYRGSGKKVLFIPDSESTQSRNSDSFWYKAGEDTKSAYGVVSGLTMTMPVGGGGWASVVFWKSMDQYLASGKDRHPFLCEEV